MVKFETVFNIRIVYKSGYTHDFEVTDFTVIKGTYNWTAISHQNAPIVIGPDEIAAIYQVGTRRRIMWV